MRLSYEIKSNLCNAFMLKCVSMTNIIKEHYMEGVINQVITKTIQAEKEKQAFLERLC